MILVLLAVAGGAGAATRFLVDGLVARHNPFRVPLGTLLINVSGSLVLGMLTGWTLCGNGGATADYVRVVLGTGFCGGYTTFSTAAVETVRLWQVEGRRPGVGYAVITLVGSVAAAAVGLAVGSLL